MGIDMHEIAFLDVDSWGKYKAERGVDLHVYLDNVDVTTRCYRAIRHEKNRMLGDVWLFKVNEAGQKYVDPETKEVAKEQLTGDLRIEAGGPMR